MSQSLLSRNGGVGLRLNATQGSVATGPACASGHVGRGGRAATTQAPLPPAPAATVGVSQRHACRSGRSVAAAATNEMSTSGMHKGSFAASISSAVDAAAAAPYKWSWTEDMEPTPPLDLDAAAVAAAASLQDLTKLLEDTAAAAPPRAALTPAARQQLGAAVQPLLAAAAASCPLDVAAGLLEAYGRVAALPRAMTGAASSLSGPEAGSSTSSSSSSVSGSSTSSELVTAVLAAAAPSLEGASAHGLADLLWAVSELEEDLPWDHGSAAAAAAGGVAAVAAALPEALQRAVSVRLAEQDFLAPDLCRVVCALGSLASSSSSSEPSTSGSSSNRGGAAGGRRGFAVPRELAGALNDEVRYQLTEFASDFSAADLGRLIAGMAGLRLGGAVAGDEEYRRILMKAVYGKTRSIADKAAVDFALSRLMSDDPEARSMHYDTRWTHEELHWLPRRERDKRRILKEGWYRTQWGGWAPGRGA